MARLPSVTAPNKEQQATYDYLLKTRGPAGLRGGFGVMLVSPELCQRMAHLGTYLRFDSQVAKLMRSVAAATISAELENPWEYTIHGRNCREQGVSETVVQAILDRSPVVGASDDELLAINLAREIARGHKLSDATFQAARKRLGEAGLVDLIATVGYYAMLAVCHVALEVAPPK